MSVLPITVTGEWSLPALILTHDPLLYFLSPVRLRNERMALVGTCHPARVNPAHSIHSNDSDEKEICPRQLGRHWHFRIQNGRRNFLFKQRCLQTPLTNNFMKNLPLPREFCFYLIQIFCSVHVRSLLITYLGYSDIPAPDLVLSCWYCQQHWPILSSLGI